MQVIGRLAVAPRWQMIAPVPGLQLHTSAAAGAAEELSLVQTTPRATTTEAAGSVEVDPMTLVGGGAATGAGGASPEEEAMAFAPSRQIPRSPAAPA